ncbi:MAG: type II toxin-antitoxin system prevent-host-death family antitoxin [Thermosynechococcaceae cyanobacterium MS004]|nr:type II toxin-antitoxin system prevent-host-death family antitoxin [Thermosynechococcaceae cyanobacterium MS004]
MTQLHPQFLTKNEKPEFVVLPYEEFVNLQERLEDLEDLLDLRNAKELEEHEPSLSLAEAKQELGVNT